MKTKHHLLKTVLKTVGSSLSIIFRFHVRRQVSVLLGGSGGGLRDTTQYLVPWQLGREGDFLFTLSPSVSFPVLYRYHDIFVNIIPVQKQTTENSNHHQNERKSYFQIHLKRQLHPIKKDCSSLNLREILSACKAW